jgi:protein SCO1
MRQHLLFVIVAGFLLGALGGAALLIWHAPPSSRSVVTTGKALIGGPFTLIDQTGKTVTDKDFRGRYMLVFFGYTHCPDICPAELQVLAASLDELGPEAKKIVPIFISLDPERDTPQVMGDYVKNFGTSFVGLTGSPDQVAGAAKAYKVVYSKVPEGQSASNYSVDHSAFVYFMGPDGQYITHFPYGTSASQVADTLRRAL